MEIKDLKPGQTHSVEGFIIVSSYGTITHSMNEMPEHGYITICPYTLTFTIPEGFNAVKQAVNAIDAEMEKERSDLAKKLQRLQAKKNELLQLSYGGNDILDAENPNDPNP